MQRQIQIHPLGSYFFQKTKRIQEVVYEKFHRRSNAKCCVTMCVVSDNIVECMHVFGNIHLTTERLISDLLCRKYYFCAFAWHRKKQANAYYSMHKKQATCRSLENKIDSFRLPTFRVL